VNFATGRGGRASFAATVRRRAVRRPLGRRRRCGAHPAWERGHDRQRLLDHEGDDRALGAHAVARGVLDLTRPWRATGPSSRRPQGDLARPLPAQPSRRPAGDPSAAADRSGSTTGSAWSKRWRPKSPWVGAGPDERIPYDHVRVPVGELVRRISGKTLAGSSVTRSRPRSAPTSTSGRGVPGPPSSRR